MKYRANETIRIYWQHLKKYKVMFFVCLIAIAGAAISNLIIPLYFKRFFDLLTEPNFIGDLFSALFGVLLILLVLWIVQWAFWRIAIFCAVQYEADTMTDLDNFCFKYLHKHSIAYFDNNFVGSLVKRVNRFVNAFGNIIDTLTWNLWNLIINIIFITIVLFTKNIVLGLAVLVWTVLFLLVNGLFTKFKLKYDIKRSAADTKISQVLADTITNHNNVKLFNGYKREVNLFATVVDDAKRLRKFTWNLDNIFEAIQGLLTTGLEFGIMYIGLILWRKGLFTVGDFVLLQAYALTLVMKVWDFGRVVRNIYENLADAEEMTEILITSHDVVDKNKASELIIKNGSVNFFNVTFCYQQTRCVLNKFNLEIKPGEKVALVGSSGAGKTTIVKLLLRMYDVTSGKILIDNQKIKDVTQESLWKNVSLVPQDPMLFHRSLAENIRYGCPEATDEEVIVASKLAHCHEFIDEFPEKYETKVGERGVKLSGGERQRVAIARAILRDAPILVLDEATSSLDSESELLIQKAMDNLMKDKTVIIVAHRLSTIMKADRILVIEDGGIIEQGTHKQLLRKKDGLYKKLWKIQAGGFIG